MPKPLWIAVEAAIGDSAKVWRFATALLTPPEAPRSPTKQEVATAIGFLVLLWGKVADKRESGDVSDVPAGLLASWAGWEGDPAKFAGAFAMFLDDGKIHDWDTHQGKLIEHRKKERVRWQTRKSSTGASTRYSTGVSAEPPPVLHPPNSYSNGNQEQQHPPPTPPRPAPDGASVGVSVVEVGTHNGKSHRNGHALVRRGREAVLERGRHALAEVVALAQQQARADDLREQMVAFVFAYWQAKHNHPNALQDRKRETLLRTRLRENRNDVSELLYAADGARKDRNLMGENDRGRKYDGIETIYRDRAQVERLASLAGYQPGLTHPQLAAAQGGAN